MSSATPAVSVIIPAYKVTSYIAETLDSLRAQTFRDFEAIVVNDGCPDTENLEAVLAPYRSEIVYIKQENRGLAGARNTALRAARAPLAALLDSDDIWESEYLATLVAAMEAHPEAGVVYPNATFFGETPFAGQTVMDFYPRKKEVTFETLLTRESWVFVGCLFKKELIERAGCFDQDLRSSEDLDLWLRLAHAGVRFVYVPVSLVRYRARPSNLSNDPIWMGQSVLKVYRKLASTLDLSPEQQRILDQAIAREEATLDFYFGKKALYANDCREARARFRRANAVLRSRKLSLTLFGLSVAPGMVYRYVRRRYPSEYVFLH